MWYNMLMNKEPILEKANIVWTLVLALFPVTNLLGLHTLFLNRIGPKVAHISLGIFLLISWIIAFMTMSCPSESICVVTTGAVLLLPLSVFSIILYVVSIVEVLIYTLKAK